MQYEKLLCKFGFWRTRTATPTKRLYKENWKEIFKNQQIDLNKIKPKGIVIGDSIAAGLFRFSSVYTSYLKNCFNLGIRGD